MEGAGSATINNVAHPKHPEEEETSPNRNHIYLNAKETLHLLFVNFLVLNETVDHLLFSLRKVELW